MAYSDTFFAIAPHCTLKRLETPCLYDIEQDTLYELSDEAYEFLRKCSQGERVSVKEEDEAFIDYCLSENLLARSDTPTFRKIAVSSSPIPSLRYLEFQITDRCNLHCRHCYVGDGFHQDIPFSKIVKVLREFEEIQGLRLLLSGGEPLLHPDFWKINNLLRNHEFRSVLLSNGTLINKENAKRLRVHEVQISLDGMKEGHESVRGEGTFEKALTAIESLREAGIRVSVATMIHRKNLGEFEKLESLIRSLEIEEWNVDVPCLAGRLEENNALCLSPSEAAPFMKYGFGGGHHASGKDTTCGAHLCAILPTGHVAKCGFFGHQPVGSIDEGLRACWERIPRIPLSALRCSCPEVETCRGGCRFRAMQDGDMFQPDLFQCYARGVIKPKFP